uniref:endogenous retrovirus group K member 13-1 Env polyprotein-like n=1 Tax=Callithrix jacchus TaxID=9483 RepID=UPI00159D8283|nr:endogenous retrovirus group K member 13-1 Env polyprotein-like [Callithrix jacchus]XP_035141819.1 endogenous retrovirus group K member 13-1 Env polyprotein-like [Callithrix jacchus]
MLFLALHPPRVYAGHESKIAKPVQTFSIRSCVAAPYVFLLGKVSFHVQNGYYTISCLDCKLTNCIDASMFPVDTILIVHQPPYVMLPVNISGPWYDEHSYSPFYKTQSLFIRRQKCFLGMLIAGIVAIVSVIASTATAAVSLTQSVNTAVYVNHLAKNVSISMGTQMSIDDKLEAKLNALEQTVTILGDKVYNLQNRLSLRCHAHYKYICVTSAPYNGSQWQWPLIKAHLQGIWSHNSLSLDISHLQQEISAIDLSQSQLPDDDSIAHSFVDAMSSWVQQFHIPSLSSLLAIAACFLVLLLCLPCAFRLLFSTLREVQLKVFALHLQSKKPGNGSVHAKGLRQ